MPNRVNSDRKGKVFERKVANMLRDQHGIKARRGQQHAGGRDSPDVVAEIPGVHIECKAVERLSMRATVKQATDDADGKPWAIVHKWNRGPVLVTVEFDRLGQLIEAWGEAKRKDGAV